jgi:hypothetical protein
MSFARRLKLRCAERSSDLGRVRPIFGHAPRRGVAHQVRLMLQERLRDVINGRGF